jgi:hypothetical protein
MPIAATKPSEEQESPNQPVGSPLVFEKFNGINISTTRVGVPDDQMAWCDSWFPLGPRYLRTMWDVGPALWSPPSGTIMFFDFANIGTLPIMVAVTSLGGIWQVVTTTGVATRIAADGTIISPLRNNVGVSQWGSQYVLIVANQTNGYWIWDGGLLYTAGSLAPGVVLTNIGSGYSSPPLVLATGGIGTGATFTATIANGSVVGVTITNPGSNYLATDAPTLTFTGGNSSGTGASLTAVVSFNAGGSGASFTISWGRVAGYYSIQSVTVNSGGSGYSPFTTIVVVPAGPYNIAAVLVPVISGGIITSVTILNAGEYNTSSHTLSASDPGFYSVTSVTINNGGSSYGPSCAIAVSGGGTPQQQASLSPVLSNGVIVEVQINSGGVYGTNSAPTLTVSDSAVSAAGTISLMPYAIQGTAIETYSGHVWIANGAVITFSAPGSVSNFATSAGGGNLTSVDSFLRVAYVRLVNSNGFLYLVADSSINYISGVQTAGTSPPVTTFTNQNADPEVGTPYAATVDVFSRNIVFANAFGAHVSYGAAVTKISEQLDGIYNTVPNFGGFQLSACKAIIFGRKIWAVLVPVISPTSGNQENKLFIWDSKKWVAAHQSVHLVYVQHQEIASIITAWGTDGLSVYPLFTTPSNSFRKTVQSRLWDTPEGYQNTKASVRLWALAQFLGTESLSYTVSIDNEFGTGTGNAVATGTPIGFSWVDAAGAPFTWQNGSAQTFTWVVTGTGMTAVLSPQAVGQVGVLTGMTTITNADDMILISEMQEMETVGYRG